MKPRCNCLACKGKTIEFSRQRFVDDMQFMVRQGLVSQAYFDESVRDFDEQHAEGAIE